MRKLLTLLAVLLLATAVFADEFTEICPEIGPGSPPADTLWQPIFYFNSQLAPNDQLELGAAWAGGFFWVTGSGASSAVTSDNKIYKFSSAGTLVSTYNQPDVASGWGFRDIAYDGTYLYAGCEATTVYAWDMSGNLVPTANVPRPAGCTNVRALGYDPANDRFWTGNFSSPVYCFDRSGATIWTGSLGLAGVYGMAWDAVSPGGPFLWIYDQSGSPVTTMKKVAGCGLTPPVPQIVASYQLPMAPTLTASTAGGAEGTSAWGTYPYAMVVMVQGTPNDELVVYEVVGGGPAPNIVITLTPVGGPITIPPGGGSFDFNANIANNETTPQNFQVWIMVTLPSGSQYGPVLGPLSLTLPGSASLTRVRTQNVPASAPAGNYIYTGRVGLYPGTVYSLSSFPFSKSGLDNQGGVSEWLNTGDAFVPETVELGNYPNPFNPTTTINFSLPYDGNVILTVYDLSGRQVAQLVDGYLNMGSHQVNFDASSLASGVYLYQLNLDGQLSTAKMVLTK